MRCSAGFCIMAVIADDAVWQDKSGQTAFKAAVCMQHAAFAPDVVSLAQHWAGSSRNDSRAYKGAASRTAICYILCTQQ